MPTDEMPSAKLRRYRPTTAKIAPSQVLKLVFLPRNIAKSGTRREEKLLSAGELDAVYALRRLAAGMQMSDFVMEVYDLMARTKDNREFAAAVETVVRK